jgi:hypothetical protein
LCLAAVASAQTTVPPTVPPGEQRIQETYNKLRTNNGLYFAITGSDRVGNISTPIGTNLYYQSSVDPNGRLQIKANLVDYVSPGSVPTTTNEVIADGKTVWIYDRMLRTYAVSPYDVQNSADASLQSPTYARDLLFSLNQATTGSGRSSYATRLLRELFADPNGAQYRSWMPGRTPVEASTYHDPINDVDVAQANCTYVVYPSDSRRSIAFEIYTNPDTGEESLQRIYVTETGRYGGKTRITSWTLAPLSTNDFTAARFTPYTHAELRSWRPVVAPRAVRG